MKRILSIVFVTLALTASTAAACPSCSESLNSPVESSAATSTAASGFNTSIWVMLAGVGLGMTAVAGVLATSLRGRRTPQ